MIKEMIEALRKTIKILTAYNNTLKMLGSMLPISDRLRVAIVVLLRLAVYMVVCFFLIWVYDEISYYWTSEWFGRPIYGWNGLESAPKFRFEYPFIAVILLVLYFGKLKNPVYKYLLPLFPIILAYSFIDVFFLYLKRLPRVLDIKSIPELYMVSPSMVFALISVFVIVCFSIVFLYFRARKEYSFWQFTQFSAAKLLLLLSLLVFMISGMGERYQKAVLFPYKWSEKKTVKKNGRLASLFFYQYKSNYHARFFTNFKNYTDIDTILYPGKPDKRPNIHIMVLESFIDPRLLKDISFNPSPLANELSALLKQSGARDGDFSHVISPVYGGDSVQADFELFTGIRALALIEPIEYNLMRGGKIHSLPYILLKHGYRTIMTHATTSKFFNERRAYKSLSIDNIQFLDEGDGGYKKRFGDVLVFDGDLFSHHLKRVEEYIKRGKTPLFTYVEGMYGHSPYRRNLKLRPDIIKPDAGGDVVNRITNSFYYRTKALAEYIVKLQTLDPTAIIYITSDHIPSIPSSISYKKNIYTNISLMFKDGKAIDVSGKRYYEIPWLIWDMLTSKEHERDISDVMMEQLYYTALKQSFEVPN